MSVEILEPYCETEAQRKFLQALIQGGSIGQAAKILGVSRRAAERMSAKIKLKAAIQGVSIEAGLSRPLAAGQELRGYSTLTKNDFGEPTWVKTRQTDEAAMEMLRAAAEAFKEDLPRYKPVRSPAQHTTNLLNTFIITDYHLGMLSWPEETGEEWDLTKANDLLTRWFQTAVERAPEADMAVLAQLGDFLHWDGLDPVTPTSKHVLDADSRFPKLVRTAIRLLRTTIDLLLKKYPKVHVIMAEGNHDMASSVWLREMLADAYSQEPRLTVDTSPYPYYCVEFGDTSLFFHHGHKKKLEKVSEVFASRFRNVWGRTRHSYAHLGHYHHDRLLETGMMVVEQHRTLAASDAYAARHGYKSGRDAKVDTYHRRFGRVNRIVISPELCLEETI